LKKSECVLYITRVTDADFDRLFEEYGSKFEPDRIRRIRECRNPNARRTLIASGMTLLSVFADYKADGSRVAYSEKGKPYIKGHRNFFFNVSHSGDYVIAAVSGQNIGVDIQKPTPYSENLVRRILSEKDRERLSDRTVSDFAFLWAAKESYSKLTGVGIASDFSDISFDEDGDSLTYIVNGETAGCGKRIDMGNGYAVVISGKFDFTVVEICNVCL